MLLLKEIITNYWAYTEQVNFPVVLLSGGKRGVGETAPFEEYNKTKSDLNNANVETVSEAAQLSTLFFLPSPWESTTNIK